MGKKFFLQRMEERKEGARVVPKRMKEGEDRDRADRIRSNFLFSFSFSSALGLGWPITWRQI